MAMNQDFDLNRLDRYVSMSLACQIQPVSCFRSTKLAEDPYQLLDQTGARFPDLEIHAISVKEGRSGLVTKVPSSRVNSSAGSVLLELESRR